MSGSLGENVRRIRKARGLGQEALAELSGVGQPMISELERGIHEPRVSTLRKLGDAMGVEVAAFFVEEAALPKVPHVVMGPEEFDELRRAANSGEMDGSLLLEATLREYEALDAYWRSLLRRTSVGNQDEEGTAGEGEELEEARELLVEARKRWRVVMFDRTEETIAIDDKRNPEAIERSDTRMLPLDEADEQIRAVVRARV